MLANTYCKSISTVHWTKTPPSSTMIGYRQQCCYQSTTIISRQLSKIINHLPSYIMTRLPYNDSHLWTEMASHLPNTVKRMPMFLITRGPKHWLFQRANQPFKNHRPAEDLRYVERNAVPAAEGFTPKISTGGSPALNIDPASGGILKIVRNVSPTIIRYVKRADKPGRTKVGPIGCRDLNTRTAVTVETCTENGRKRQGGNRSS